jgi:hypothetical protein
MYSAFNAFQQLQEFSFIKNGWELGVGIILFIFFVTVGVIKMAIKTRGLENSSVKKVESGYRAAKLNVEQRNNSLAVGNVEGDFIYGKEDKKKDKQFIVQEEIERLMNDAVSKSIYFANDCFPDGEPSIKERYIAAHEANKKFWEYYKDNRRYVSKKVSTELDNLKIFLKKQINSINILYGAGDHLKIAKYGKDLELKSIALREKNLDDFRKGS